MVREMKTLMDLKMIMKLYVRLVVVRDREMYLQTMEIMKVVRD